MIFKTLEFVPSDITTTIDSLRSDVNSGKYDDILNKCCFLIYTEKGLVLVKQDKSIVINSIIDLSEYSTTVKNDSLYVKSIDGYSLISNKELERLSKVSNYDDFQIKQDIDKINKEIYKLNEKTNVITTTLTSGWNIVSLDTLYDISWTFIGQPFCYTNDGNVVTYNLRNINNNINDVTGYHCFEIYVEKDCEFRCTVMPYDTLLGINANYVKLSCEYESDNDSTLQNVLKISNLNCEYGYGFDNPTNNEGLMSLEKNIEIKSLKNNGVDKINETNTAYVPISDSQFGMGIEAPEGPFEPTISNIIDYISYADNDVIINDTSVSIPSKNKITLQTENIDKTGLYYLSLQTIDDNKNDIRIETDTGYWGLFESPNYGFVDYEDGTNDLLLVYLRQGINNITLINQGSSMANIGGLKINDTTSIENTSQFNISECKLIYDENNETEATIASEVTYDNLINASSNAIGGAQNSGGVWLFNASKSSSVDVALGVTETGYYNISLIIGCTTPGSLIYDDLIIQTHRGDKFIYSRKTEGGFDFGDEFTTSVYLLKGNRTFTISANCTSGNGIYLRGIKLIKTSTKPVMTNLLGTINIDDAPFAGVYNIRSDKAITITNDTGHKINLSANSNSYIYLLKGANNVVLSDNSANLNINALEYNGYDYISSVQTFETPITSNQYVLGDALFTPNVGNIIDWIYSKDDNVSINDNSITLPSNSKVTLKTDNSVLAGLYYMSIQLFNDVKNNIKLETDTGYYGEYTNPKVSGKQTHYEDGESDFLLVYLRQGENLITLTNNGSSDAVIGGVCCSKASVYAVGGKYATDITSKQFTLSNCKITPTNNSETSITYGLNVLTNKIIYDAPYTGVYEIKIKNHNNLNIVLTNETGHAVQWNIGDTSPKYFYMIQGKNEITINNELPVMWSGLAKINESKFYEEFIIDLDLIKKYSSNNVLLELFSAWLNNIGKNTNINLSTYTGNIDIKNMMLDTNNNTFIISANKTFENIKPFKVNINSISDVYTDYETTYNKVIEASMAPSKIINDEYSISIKC